ncbi:MAG: ribonuclease HII [Candidatus Eisenbacteria bacterium]|uniref:Ribonuclease HII n=1 Tax=Eiseniibacteriota bacterium TaxID=2212470 RepID=A0A9D6L8L4_UNCEI|nr:ribonuclease HII [Candidatus Eisenbacteria bacterium]MBI3538668.1 ribonuclease HII [Candidatus Eisenbacteria bacterium]
MAVWRRLARAEARVAGERATVAGVDEAGRGPLAGPVVAAAVVLDPAVRWDGIHDSKQVDAGARAELYTRVLERARAFGWAVIGPRAIDHMNIRRASLEAMRRAVARLRVTPTMVLVDGADRVPGLAIAQEAVVDGDATMLSIAAASIVAKVVRDRIMERLDRVWPDYGFARHKGYSTPEHLAALARRGPCPIHRYSYAPVAFQELPFEAPAAETVAVTIET